MKTLALYREQMGLLRQEQRKIVEDIVQVLFEAKQDGHSFSDVMDDPRPTPEQPALGFDL